MKKVLLTILSFFLVLFLAINSTSAADFTPQGNINLRDYYNITNVPYYKGTTINITGVYYGNGSQLTDLTLTESDPHWTGNQSSYSNTTVILGWNFYNATDFDIADYFTAAIILGFSYYNATDFSIAISISEVTSEALPSDLKKPGRS